MRTLAILFGGRSSEHEVSIRSARAVAAAAQDRFRVEPVAISREGLWQAGEGAWRALETGRVEGGEPLKAFLPRFPAADAVFPVLHGPFGEDGTVQGLLELLDLPYVGPGVLGSAAGLDKVVAKQLFEANGLPVLPWTWDLAEGWLADPEAARRRVEERFTYPVFVKPANAGSSIGVTKVHGPEELIPALERASRYDRKVIVEQGIPAREIEVSVLGNDDPQASVPGEVVPGHEFYDYADKYLDDKSRLLIPAPLPRELAERIRRLAVAAYRALDGAGMSRVDFLLHKETEEPYVNEVNTIPGFTEISMYPKLWEASGLPFPDLVERLVDLAVERHRQRARIRLEVDL